MMTFAAFLTVFAVANGNDPRQSCPYGSPSCKADVTSDNAALLQTVSVKKHSISNPELFTTPQSLMECEASAISTTDCMTTTMYDDVVTAVGNILFNELNTTCDAVSCQQADWAGCVLRMAGHDFMDFKDGKGGADACTDMNEPDNAGLSVCLASGEFGHSLKDLYAGFCTTMSLADFEVIAAQAVMSLLATSGDSKEMLAAGLKTNFKFGRTTATGEACREVTHREGQLLLPNPALGCSEVERVFVNNMGLTWEEATALMGVHSLGRAQTSNSGYDGYWMSPEHSRTFNNQYYIAILAVSWCPEYNVGGNENKHQWQRCDTGRDERPWKEMMLNTDMCLAYAGNTGQPLIADPTNDDSNCCAWVHSAVSDYDMTQVIANNANSFCNVNCSDEYSCGSKTNAGNEWRACCEFEPTRSDCSTPGMGKAFLWNSDAQKSAPGAEAVRQFAADEIAWINVFLTAWAKATENGFGEDLTPLVEAC